ERSTSFRFAPYPPQCQELTLGARRQATHLVGAASSPQARPTAAQARLPDAPRVHRRDPRAAGGALTHPADRPLDRYADHRWGHRRDAGTGVGWRGPLVAL